MDDLDQAREYHRLAMESDEAGRRYRDRRDVLARTAWEKWNGSIADFAQELGWTHQLASKVIHSRRRLSSR